MTKRREPLTYHHTLTKVAARLGWDRCAAICGVTERMVRYWSDPDCETEIRMIDAERLDRAYMDHGGDHAPFQRLMTLRLDLAGRQHHADLAHASSMAAKEAGEAISAMIEATTPNCPASIRMRAKVEAEQAIEALTNGIAALNAAERKETAQ
ncbi:hypothetical protein GTZ99_03035 [Novosphingobium sp. FSY-8]|uniref:Uncharacterized protein n=1 Tax=Novosphingobium ovatum TaxID=1908523 RepID=A0ABW9XAG3_9SPHN|nr:hypothetical protein [Novosphingobium ovatum]NBC35526.1 hypothetical protein [Novosphingobium ovatum]